MRLAQLYLIMRSGLRLERFDIDHVKMMQEIAEMRQCMESWDKKLPPMNVP